MQRRQHVQTSPDERGGTGGHINPAAALTHQISLKDPSVNILFAGGHLNKNPFFSRLEIPFENISCGPFNSKNLVKLGASLCLNVKGAAESVKIIKKFKPDLIVGFGSYHSLPMMIAAVICRVPLILYASDCHPGKVIRLFSMFSKLTAVQFEEAAPLLKGPVRIVSMPFRQGIKKNSIPPAEAKKYYGFEENALTLLVFGGSQGAAAINDLLSEVIEKKGQDWAGRLQVIHLTGKEASIEILKSRYEKKAVKACVKAFEDRMDMAWQASDFVISRAGAASIAEQIEFEVPGILIPYPFAADNHQEKNSRVMERRIGAAEVILEKDMTTDLLIGAISKFMEDKCCTLLRMKAALAEYKKNRQTLDLSDLVLENL